MLGRLIERVRRVAHADDGMPVALKTHRQRLADIQLVIDDQNIQSGLGGSVLHIELAEAAFWSLADLVDVSRRRPGEAFAHTRLFRLGAEPLTHACDFSAAIFERMNAGPSTTSTSGFISIKPLRILRRLHLSTVFPEDEDEVAARQNQGDGPPHDRDAKTVAAGRTIVDGKGMLRAERGE